MKLSQQTIALIQAIMGQHPIPRPFRVLLFGSFAKGNACHRSDIDIAIRGKAPLPLGLWAQIESDFEDSDIPQKVDVVDFHRVSEEFKRVIEHDGVVLMEGS